MGELQQVRPVIRPATMADAGAIARIYNHYVAHTVITFEEHVVSAEEMAERIAENDAISLPWLVLEHEGRLTGYACASRWKSRSAYRYSVEVTVYLAPDASGRGLGTELYAALFAELRAKGLHVAIGGIALPNPASVALHEKFGMKKVAHFEQVGFKFGEWIDVGYWQARLDK